MKSNLLRTALFLAVALTSIAYSAEPEIRQLPAKVQAKITALSPEYAVFSPEGHDGKSKLPLLIFLHGGGGKGDDIAKAQRIATPAYRGMKKFSKTPCWFVVPQCAKGEVQEKSVWLPEDLDLLLAHLKSTLQVDESRIYLTGTSMGGYGSWVWAAHSPGHFAAVVPIVGGLGIGGPKDVTPDLDRWAESLAKIPVWAFHGAKDNVVPAERSQRMIALIQKKGGKRAKLTIFPDEGHGAGRRVFSSAKVYDWMFSQARD